MQNLAQIEVVVCEPLVKEGHPNYISYTIQGCDSKGPFENQQRFSNFYTLRQNLIAKWPGCYIPPLPQKLLKGNFDNKQIIKRMTKLNYFLNQLSKWDHLWYSEEVQDFLRKGQSMFQDLEFTELMERYSRAFPELKDFKSEEQLVIKVEQFQLFLQNARPILEQHKQKLKLMRAVSKQHNEQKRLLLEFFFPEYENIFIRQYVKKSTTLPFQGSVLEKSRVKESHEYKELICQLKLEIQEQDVAAKSKQALMQMLQDRDKYVKLQEQLRRQLQDQVETMARLQNGQLNFVQALFTTHEASMNKAMAKLKSLETNLRQACLITEWITKIIAKQIDSFKEIRQVAYKHTLALMAEHFIEKSKENLAFYYEVAKKLGKGEEQS